MVTTRTRAFGNILLLALLAGSRATGAAPAAEGPVAPFSLRCEYLDSPSVIDTPRPRFFWALDHSERNQVQSAYQILVSTDPLLGQGDQWDSGKVASDDSGQVEYAGLPLASNRTYYWKVRYWDRGGHPSLYSSGARFDTGLFSAEEWEGDWIGGNRTLRKEFRLGEGVRRARVFVTAQGYYELHLNGSKLGNNVLDPGWTTVEKRVLYSSYDITGLLRKGPNVVGALLGQGWNGTTPGAAFLKECEECRALRLQMIIELESGEQIRIASDPSWTAHRGPLLSDSIYQGEIYDARLETPGWDQPGFDAAGWTPGQVVPIPEGIALSAQMMPPVQVVDTIVPLEMHQPAAGVYIYDMGQNFTGWVRLKVRGPRGTRVQMRHGEVLYADGHLNAENLRTARSRDIYILRGSGEEIYEPRFTYHGFRYVELTGYPGVPTLDTIRGRVVHTAVGQTGSFSSSNPLLNRLQSAVVWGQKTNLHSIPTDCPQRNERMGWLGDAHIYAESAIMNFDMAAFYSNYVRTIRDTQGEDGSIPDTVPHRFGSRDGDPAWSAAYPLLCWYLYRYYDDRRVLEENYRPLAKYVEFLGSRSEGGLVKYSRYGDWVSLQDTPGSLVSAFYHYYDVSVLSQMAAALGKAGDAARYASMADQIKARFHEAFFDPQSNHYAGGSQTANALPLFLDMVPGKVRGNVLRNLYDDILYNQNTHVTTGFLGVKYLMELLTDTGRSWLAYELATQTTYPSWGYMLENGATTLWEVWQNRTGPLMNSHNHPMLGSVGSWLYKALAGINLDPQENGFKKIRIVPNAVRDLRHAAGSIETLRGPVLSSWEVSPSKQNLKLEVTIPVNSRADIYFPRERNQIVVREGGREVWNRGVYHEGTPGIVGAAEATPAFFLYSDAVVISVGSGHYSFEFTAD